MAFSHEIGSSHATRVTLSSLGVPPPQSLYDDGERKDLWSGQQRASGWATATWYWQELPIAARESLKVYCSGVSAEVAIYTPTNDNDDEFKGFTAIMIWPHELDKAHSTHNRRNFSLTFRILEEYIPDPPE